MRTEQEMFELILNVAKRDERVRAVVMNGSRTNSKVKKDRYQDYDIVYLVTEVNSYLEQPHWIDVFGDRLIMQTPQTNTLFEPVPSNRFTYLMQFKDGNRIDLTLVPLVEQEMYLKEDQLTIILLDKDNCLPIIPPSTDEDYWVKRPTKDHFDSCCNEFWWVSTYVAKGLWRNEWIYAIEHLDVIRRMLYKMIDWYVGIDTNFSLSVGKNHKYLNKYLEEDLWFKLLDTYPQASQDAIWSALFTCCELFKTIARKVANHFNYVYLEQEYQDVEHYLFQKQV